MFNRSKVDELVKKEQQKLEREKQEIKNLKLACSEIFKTTNGKYILRALKNFCGWNDQDMNVNADILAYKKGRRDVWVFLRNILPKDVVAQIEIYDEINLQE